METIWLKRYEKEVPAKIRMPEWTMDRLFRQSVDKNPQDTATLFFGARLRWDQLGHMVERFASALASSGVGPGDRIAVILPNMPAYPIAHFATWRLGGVLVPTNPLYVERELEYQLSDSGAETVVILDQLYPRFAEIRVATAVKRVIVVSISDFLPSVLRLLYRLRNKPVVQTGSTEGVYTYRDFLRRAGSMGAPAQVSADDVAILLYTGGTTGFSKGAVLTHRNLAANVTQTRAWLWSMKDEQEVLLCVLPFFHSYGMTTGLHLAVLSRSTMVLVPRFDLGEVLKRIRKHAPTVFCGVPSMYQAINRYPKVSAGDLSSIRRCISGGARLPGEVQKRFEGLTGGKLVEGYGLSETSPVTHVNPTFGVRKNGSIGVPVPGTEAMVVDPTTRSPQPADQVGELAIRGPQVMQGYWNRPEETNQVLQDGWLYTGDLARMDQDGFFFIVDRKKDLIISAGMNVYPREVEEVLLGHPKVVEVAVVGVPSTVREEIVKAYVVADRKQMPTKRELVQFCWDKLARYKVPKRVEFVKELPKSALGKVLKRQLQTLEKDE